jgi:hypothetical protein
MSYEPRDYDDHYGREAYGQEGYGPEDDVARARVGTPAVLLIIVSVLNILVGLFMLFRGAQLALTPIDQFREQQEMMLKMLPPDMAETQKGTTPEELKMQSSVTAVVSGVVYLVTSVLTLFGGIRMKGLRSYGLAMVAAIIALVPCLSPSACCLLGEIAGIWAIAVLLNQDVKSAFQ